MVIVALLALTTLIIWLGLAVFWHGFWRTDQRLGNGGETRDHLPSNHLPSICAIIPARNEQDTIAVVIQSLVAQDYSGRFSVIVVNDSSTDETAATAKAAAADHDHIKIIDAPALADGWAGKMWALANGVEEAALSEAEYYWFTDADIRHHKSVLRQLVDHAQRHDLGLVSEMVKLRCQTFWEKLLVPAFLFYFALIYPFRAVNNPASKIAGAAGGSLLIKRTVLQDMGGIAAVKKAVIDDCSIGKKAKQSGAKIWLGLSDKSYSLRPYETLGSFWSMVHRSAYTQLGYSPILLVGVISGLLFSHATPILLALGLVSKVSLAGFIGLGSWLVMALIYRPSIVYCGLSPFWALTLPFSALLFGTMTITSAVSYYLGRGKNWRGREIN